MSRPAGLWFWKNRGYATDAGGRRRVLVACSRRSKVHRELAQHKLSEVLLTQANAPSKATATGISRLAEIIDLFLADCRLRVDAGDMKPNTLALFYRKFLLPIRKGIGHWRLSQISRDRLLRFCGEMKARRLSKNTIRNYLSCLRTCVKWARSQGIPVANGIHSLKLPARQRRLQIPSNEQIERLIAAAPRQVADVLETLFTNAVRPGDLYNLRWAEVDLGRGELVLADSKTGARVVHLSSRGEAVLRRRRQERTDDGDFVFRNLRGGRWTMDTFADHIRQIRRKEGLPEFLTSYVVRHCWTTNAFLRGLDVATVKTLRGDSDVRTTLLYEHLTTHLQHLKDAARKAAGEQFPAGDK